MKKMSVIISVAVVLIFTMTLHVSAAVPGRGKNINGYGICIGLCETVDYCLLRDESGAFFDRDIFEANLDKAIDDGLINAEDKEYYLEKYDYCVTNGSSAVGLGKGRRNGGGRGINCRIP